MAFVNYNSKEITVKIVYYGPALSGKTTCLKYIYTSKKFDKKGKLITLDTDGDRTLFFDFLPIEIGKLGDYSIKMQLYTVPGQVAYDTTRKLVLQGADGVAFVADSQRIMREQNIESFENLKVNLELNNISYSDIPIILLYNKRDIHDVMPVTDLNRALNPEDRPSFETIATKGENIIESLQEIMRLVIVYLRNRLSIFQKDKTVMFSREDIIAKSMGKNVAEPQQEDAEKDVMELSSPISNSPIETEPFPDGDGIDIETDTAPEAEVEDIFNLDDDGIMGSVDHGLGDEDQEVLLQSNNILGEEDKEIMPLGDPVPSAPPFSSSPLPASPALETEPEPGPAVGRIERKIEFEAPAEAAVKNLDIPLNIDIPEGKDEIKINLNLHIVVKKKK